jgi:hypothetical protein
MKLIKELIMFKKTLLAVATVAAFASASANAAEVTLAGGQVEYSKQGVASAAAFTLPDVTITLGAEYTENDLITLEFNTAIDPETLESTLTAVLDGGIGTDGSVTFGLLGDATADSATYRVTAVEVNDASGTSGGTMTLSGIELDAAALIAAGGTNLSFSAKTSSDLTLETSASFVDADNGDFIIKLSDQFSAQVDAEDILDGVIDVTNDPSRTVFDDGSEDTLTVDFAEAALTEPATLDSITVTLNGDFSFLVDEDDETDGIQNSSVVASDLSDGADAIVGTVTYTATSVTVVYEGAISIADVGSVTLTFDNADNDTGAEIINAGEFTADVSFGYTDQGTDLDGTDAETGSVVVEGEAAGEWTLNGSTSIVEAYPVSEGITQFLWVTNSGNLAGDISVTAVANGETYDLGMVGTAEAKTLTSIRPAVNEALAAEGLTSGRVQLTVTVNAPATSIDVYAGYKVDADADRLTLTVN